MSQVAWDSGCIDARDDDERFAEMYRTFAPRVRALADRRLRGRGLADDVVQETFLRVHRSFARFDAELPPWPWLKMIATNVCNDVLRSRQAWAEQMAADIGGLETLPGGELPADALLAKERRQGIATVLSGMNPRQRRALLLTGVEGWKAEDVADLEGTSVTAIRSTLKRGRQAFRSNYLALATERGLLGVGALVGAPTAARLRAFVRRYRAATSGGASATAIAGPLHLASAILGAALLGGLVVAAPWSHAVTGTQPIARTADADAADALPAPGAADDAADGGAAESKTEPAITPSGAAPLVVHGVDVPEADAAVAVAATASIEDGERSTLVATVEATLAREGVDGSSITGASVDLHCGASEARQTVCDAATDSLRAP